MRSSTSRGFLQIQPIILLLISFAWIAAEIISRQSALIDFMVYWYAAENFFNGSSLYAQMISFSVSRSGDSYLLPYLYPPFFLIVILPFHLFELETAKVLWTFLMLVCFMSAALLVPYVNPIFKQQSQKQKEVHILISLCFLLVFKPIWISLLLGQPTGLLALLLVVAVYAVTIEAAHITVVLCCLLALFKMTPIYLMIIPLLWRQPRTLMVGIATFFICSLVTILIPGGATSVVEFFTVLPTVDLSQSHPSVLLNLSPISLLREPLHTRGLAWLATGISLIEMLLPILLILFLRRRKFAAIDAYEPGIIAIYSLSPIAWSHHLPLIGLALAILVQRSIAIYNNQKVYYLLAGIVYILLAYGSNLAKFGDSLALEQDCIRLLPNIGVVLLLLLICFKIRYGAPVYERKLS